MFQALTLTAHSSDDPTQSALMGRTIMDTNRALKTGAVDTLAIEEFILPFYIITATGYEHVCPPWIGGFVNLTLSFL